MRNSPNRIVATVFGAVYVLVGLLGFAVTGGIGFIATEGGLLLGVFQVNPLHNIAHLLIGAALLIAGFANVSAAKTVNTIVGGAYLLLGIVGFFLAGTAANILALNTADHFLHLASAIVLLGVGLASRAVRTRGDGLGSLAMTALTTMARTWPMLAAFGAGLVLLALAAGAGGTAGGALAGAGIAGLGWGVLSLHAGRAIVPATALGVSVALLVGAGAVVGTRPRREHVVSRSARSSRHPCSSRSSPGTPRSWCGDEPEPLARTPTRSSRRMPRHARPSTAGSRSWASSRAPCSSRVSRRRRSRRPRPGSSRCRTGSTAPR